MMIPGPHVGMVPYEQALELVTSSVKPLRPETVPLNGAQGRYLAVPLKARYPMPRFDQSAMDGYAVFHADLDAVAPGKPVTLEVVGEMPAGGAGRPKLRRGRTVKVFTGGRLPAGADTVVMKEYVDFEDDRAGFLQQPKHGANIRRLGEELQRGAEILPARTRITPPVVGLLASMDRTEVRVHGLPTVTVITMGDELVAPGKPLGPGQIRDANGPALRAALQALGIRKIRVRRVRDSVSVLQRTLAAAMESSDLVITVGGASVGDHDHVAAARSLLGVKELYSRVAVKPGKPNIFGLGPGGVPMYGLPGNPVSALVSFHQFVKPLIAVMMGAMPGAGRSVSTYLPGAEKKKSGRTYWLRGRLVPRGPALEADLAAAQQSHMLTGLAAADILAELPADTDHVDAGALVRAWLIDWDKT
ncbi:MAG: molybdopterin molybdotransferase MoeA [bacterium]|nr:molybdopterin molybdotransferase MoeA [bacterium]